MNTIIILPIVVPLLFALLFLISSSRMYYKILSGIFSAFGIAVSIFLVLEGPSKMLVSGSIYQTIEIIITLCEVLLFIYLFYVSIKNKRWHVFSLVGVSTLLSIYMIILHGDIHEAYVNIDKLSIVIAAIVNVIGTLIILFSNEYMKEYEHHRHMKSRQKLFYPAICIFLSAMNGLIFSDSLSWIYFFWEITTIISFLLISYNNDTEALNSGFRALFLNLIGGICFSLGIILCEKLLDINSLSQVIESGKVHSLFIIPVFLLCIAGFTKSAQLPFQSWLLGAMVAPTPVSALLHSSTMVNAGVYLIVKLSPAYADTMLGSALAIYGSLTFLICSAIAITQRNAKRVLAYSTIANLGLVIASAGMGSSLGISAAILLIIFHAVSKALLFLCTGQIEHVIGSRDIEDMSGLIRKAPILTMVLVIGILSMILPPFGVLITKWISIEASASNPLVVVLLALGSAFTTAFWIKWLGSVLAYPVKDLKPKYKMEFTTYFPLGVLCIGVFFTSIFLPTVFNKFVSPEVTGLLESQNQLAAGNGNIYSQAGSFNDAVILVVLFAVIAVSFLIRKFVLSPNLKKVYLCGENDPASSGTFRFRSGNGYVERAFVSNIYMSSIIDEKRLTVIGCIISVAMIIIILLGGLL